MSPLTNLNLMVISMLILNSNHNHSGKISYLHTHMQPVTEWRRSGDVCAVLCCVCGAQYAERGCSSWQRLSLPCSASVYPFPSVCPPSVQLLLLTSHPPLTPLPPPPPIFLPVSLLPLCGSGSSVHTRSRSTFSSSAGCEKSR